MTYKLLPYTNVSSFTDFYELTAAQAYLTANMQSYNSVFHYFFRRCPFNGSYVVAAGLDFFLDYIENLHFDDSIIDFLYLQKGDDGERLFSDNFLDYLKVFKFTGSIHAIPEGRLTFPHEPLIRVTAPIIEAQIIETALLTINNFQSLVATKAARITSLLKGQIALEFGARRAHGIDGALSASRAAFIGGFAATSNTYAAYRLGIPCKGTMMHAYVMSFNNELEAFRSYCDSSPNNITLLVDTYDSYKGIENAILVAKEILKKSNNAKISIRLDSGDLNKLAKYAKKRFREEHVNINIAVSNDLNEEKIRELKLSGAPIDVWGVGTQVVTGSGYKGDNGGALGGVYKLSALSNEQDIFIDKIKFSQDKIKTSIPGILNVRRFRDSQYLLGDCIYDIRSDISKECVIYDSTANEYKRVDYSTVQSEDLLKTYFLNGERLIPIQDLKDIQFECRNELRLLHDKYKHMDNLTLYKAGLEKSLYEKRMRMSINNVGIKTLKLFD